MEIGFLAFIILPVIGGLTAWAGDVIGYRLGKSRRSLFGLRPRFTARLIGVAVGVILPLIGLGTAAAISPTARLALFRINVLRAQEETLAQENRTLENQTKSAQQRAADLKLVVDQTDKKRETTENRLVMARSRLRVADHGVRQLRANVNNLLATKQDLTDRVKSLQAHKTDVSKQLAEVQSDLAKTNQELKKKEGDLAGKEAELAQAEAQAEGVAEAYAIQRQVVTGPVLFEPGHELVRAIMRVNRDQKELADALHQLLVTASEAAFNQGAQLGRNGLAVKAIYPLPPSWDPARDPDPPSEDDIINYVASQLAQSGQSQMVVGVRVAKRLFKREQFPALVEFWAVPYVKTFGAGDVICTVPIDGSASRAEIFTQVWNLITKVVRRDAQEKGLLPHPKTGEYGSLPPAQLLGAIDAISAIKGMATVQVVAAKDTYTTGPLTVKIEVKRADTAQQHSHNHRRRSGT